MADELAGVLTDLGAYLIEQAYQAGEVVQITEMALGDGGGSDVVVSPDVTELVGEFHRQLLDGGPDEESALGGSINYVPAPEDAGKWLREFGLYDSLGNLIVYAAYSPTQLPENPNMAVQFIISLMVPIMNIEAIEIVVNPEGTVTDAQLLEHEQSRRHPAAAEGAQGMITLATPAMVAEGTDHTSAVTPAGAAAAFAPLQHEHEISDVLFLEQELDSKQPLDTLLTALAALATAPDKMAYFTGVDTVALATLSAFARTLLDDADAAAARGTLGAAPASHTHTPSEAGAAPAVHGHAIADISGLQGALDGKSPTGHSHTASDVKAVKADMPHANNWTSAAPMAGKKWIGGYHADCTGVSESGVYISFGVTGAGTPSVMDLFIDGEIYANQGVSRVYHQGFKPTAAEVGAAPTSHTHTAAQGNQDIVASSYGQVGTYAFAARISNSSTATGGTRAGSDLAPSTSAGDPGNTGQGTFTGTWKCLGACWSGNQDLGSTLWIRVDAANLFELPFTLTDARWDGAEHNSVTAIVTFTESGETMPFTASRNDSEPHGRWLFALARDGQFGEVAEYVPPTPLEIATRDNPKLRRGEMAHATAMAQHYSMMGDQQFVSYWCGYYRLVYEMAQDPQWPLVSAWPTRPE